MIGVLRVLDRSVSLWVRVPEVQFLPTIQPVGWYWCCDCFGTFLRAMKTMPGTRMEQLRMKGQCGVLTC